MMKDPIFCSLQYCSVPLLQLRLGTERRRQQSSISSEQSGKRWTCPSGLIARMKIALSALVDDGAVLYPCSPPQPVRELVSLCLLALGHG